MNYKSLNIKYVTRSVTLDNFCFLDLYDSNKFSTALISNFKNHVFKPYKFENALHNS